MTLIAKTYWNGLPFRFRRAPDHAELEPRILRTEDMRELRAMYWTPDGTPHPRTAVLALHPRVDFTQHYAFPRLLDAGIGCLGVASRYATDDVDIVHEDLLLDVGASVRWLREHRDVERVVLLGNSGAGALGAFYQAQATRAPGDRFETTPGGRPTKLASATLPPADALVLLAAHRGPGEVLAKCIDASVVDEHSPLATDPALDMYNPDNGFREPPEWSSYKPGFVSRYRMAQQARLKRIDALARSHIEAARTAGAPRPRHLEIVMTIYRTMADLNYVTRDLDPSERSYGSLLSDQPHLMNMRRLGFARVCTPEAWLSTWSVNHSRAGLLENLAEVEIPTLVIEAGADREIHPFTDQQPVRKALDGKNADVLHYPEARHYFEDEIGRPDEPVRSEMLSVLVDWIHDTTRTPTHT